MVKIKEFYKKKRVFVTGHTGFKGSWLINVLHSFDSKIAGYSKNDDKKIRYKKFCNYRKVKNYYGDILDFKKLSRAIKSFKPDIIFHLAAQALVSKSFSNPYETVNTNLVGTLNILEIVKNYTKIKSTVIITSDKCYLNQEINRGYSEKDILGGKDPYSASKAAAENIFFAYNHSFFKNLKYIGIATARAGNVIGGGDWSKNRIIPDCAKSILKKKDLIIRNPNYTRPWQHVLEPISGYLLLAKKLTEKPNLYSGSYNFGPSLNQTLAVKKVVNIFFQELGIKKKILRNKGRFKESKILKLNSNKSKKILNWKNIWSMKKSINETAKWYEQYIFNKKNIKVFTLDQIRRYFL